MANKCLSKEKFMIIAEIGQNHNGSMSLAKELICAAHEAGADIAKFQLFEARKLFSKENNPWYEYNLSTELKLEQAEMLFNFCNSIGIEFMASAFDVQRVSWLESFGVRHHKIASRSIHDQDLIDMLSNTGKPLLVSLGFWKSKSLPKFSDMRNVHFLHCISQYPAPFEQVKLSEIDFDVISGLSDHCLGLAASLAAISRGAKIIEKHFTLDKKMYGPDHSCSATPNELRDLVSLAREIRASL